MLSPKAANLTCMLLEDVQQATTATKITSEQLQVFRHRGQEALGRAFKQNTLGSVSKVASLCPLVLSNDYKNGGSICAV